VARDPRDRAPGNNDDPQLDLPLYPERRPTNPVREDSEPPFFRPRKRTQVQRVRRGPLGRFALMLNVVALSSFGACAVWTGYSKAMASEQLKVTKLEVRGGHFLSEGEVRELLGPAVGENILSLDIEGLKGRLRVSPWVESAHVRRTLPDTLSIDIVERQPVALAEIDRLYLMDAGGSLIEMYGPRTADFDLPIVRGLGGLGLPERRERAHRVAELLADLGDLSAEVSEVTVQAGGDLQAVLRGGEVLALGGPPFRHKFSTFLGLRTSLRERCPNALLFDLRFRDRIYVQERSQ
jgi:cell division septal protein FtsQ